MSNNGKFKFADQLYYRTCLKIAAQTFFLLLNKIDKATSEFFCEACTLDYSIHLWLAQKIKYS